MNAKFFLVGGAVRDKLAGLKPKDLDYAVEAESFAAMRQAIADRGGKIYVEHEEFLTIRAKVAPFGDQDYVLCRKDGSYDKDGRRPDFVEVGTLMDDLARRDFSVNAMAESEDGQLIDPFGGQIDLADKILRCVGNVQKRMHEDSLRALRALRFAITKGFGFSRELESYLHSWEAADALQRISSNRIRDELFRCFNYDTLATLRKLEIFWRIRNHIFDREIRLVPTIYEK